MQSPIISVDVSSLSGYEISPRGRSIEVSSLPMPPPAHSYHGSRENDSETINGFLLEFDNHLRKKNILVLIIVAVLVIVATASVAGSKAAESNPKAASSKECFACPSVIPECDKECDSCEVIEDTCEECSFVIYHFGDPTVFPTASPTETTDFPTNFPTEHPIGTFPPTIVLTNPPTRQPTPMPTAPTPFPTFPDGDCGEVLC